MSNTPYYQAEDRLIATIGNMDPDTLVRKLGVFIRNSSPDVNRQLFDAFGVVEAVEEDDEG